MSGSFRLTPLAERDVRDIVFYVAARFGRSHAEYVRTQFLATFRLLAEHPELGRHRTEIWAEPYRFWSLAPCLIAYRGDVSPIEIVRVARASRDWPALPR
jgi:plasmid stabilization system protein ParE